MLDILDFIGFAIIWRMLFKKVKKSYFSCPSCKKDITETKSINLLDKKKHSFQCPHCEYVFVADKTLNPDSKTPSQQEPATNKICTDKQDGKGNQIIAITVSNLQK